MRTMKTTKIFILSAALALGTLATSLLLRAALPGSNATVLNVSIREWDVPTPNARPHDPAVGLDGALWFSEQSVNKLGRLDPATGKIREFPLKTVNTGPHGLVADRDGNIWYTGNYSGLIGKLDPRTGKVTEYKMPDRLATDPHTPVFD